MAFLLHHATVLSQTVPPMPSSDHIFTWAEKGSVLGIIIVLAVIGWQIYVRIAKPAQDASIEVAKLNSTSALASRDGMLAFERAMAAQKASADELRETAELQSRNLDRQERLTSIMIAHTGSTGEADDNGKTETPRFSPRQKGG